MEPSAPDTSPTPAKKPWPMKWIVLVIVAYIAGYTFINIAYRKPTGSAHEPAVEARERKLRTVQTTMNGWTRMAATYSTGDEAPGAMAAAVTEKPLPDPLDRSLPPDLPPIVPGLPSLHPSALALSAPAHAGAGDALHLRLEFSDNATVPAFGEILAYAKDNHLYVFVQDHKRVAPDTTPTAAHSPLWLVLPPAALNAGTWQGSLFTARSAYTWSFTVE